MITSSSLLKKLSAVLGLFFLSAALSLFAADPIPASTTHESRLPTLYVCGDSTAAPSKPPILGWGEVVGEFFDPARIRIENRAMGGRSARTFISEGRWEAVHSKLQKGDFVMLQFGHNDSKSWISADRYDLPGLGDEVESITSPGTGEKTEIHTFGFYMRKMIDEGLASGATVIVLSPVPRSQWSNGKIVRGEEGHAAWAAALAKEKRVPFLDANTLIADVYDPIGRAKIKALYFPQDNTHTNPIGARINAASVVRGLIALDSPLAVLLKNDGAANATHAIAGVPTAAAALKVSIPLKNAFPAADATEVCPDTPLRLTFSSPPTLGSSGKIRILDAADNAVIETIEVQSPVAAKAIGGLPDYKYYPVIISGTQATIFPKNGALAYGKSYTVTIDEGVFKEGADAYSGVDQAAAWRFTTRKVPPSKGSTKLTVAADGTGDFCTVQGALDFIPDGNTTPTTIALRKGTYTEMVFFTNKNAITLVGEDRKQSVIEYATNERFNPAGGNPYASSSNPSGASHDGGHIYHRGVFLAHRVNDLVLTNLTIRNSTPQGGSQAEAIIFNGTPTARAILKDVDLYSYQDTLQINGQAYLNHCYIEGDVDFMWGTGPCVFEDCTACALRSGAYYTQIRNPATNHGYVYLRCTFNGAQGIMGNYLSRIGAARFPASEVVLLDCVLTSAVGPVGWQFQGPGDATNVHFWEFNSHDPSGQPVEVRQRLAGSRQLKQPADAVLIDQYNDLAWVLGNGWNPKTAPLFAAATTAPSARAAGAKGAPIITLQPAGQLALLGTDLAFTVVATSGPRPTYQWTKDGHPIPGATSPTLRIKGVKWDDAANYAVTVGNPNGSLTSDVVELTPVAPQTGSAAAPELPSFPEALFDVTTYGAVADGTTDNTQAIQKTIDTAIAEGGGIVLLPAGPKSYLCGPIKLGSHINFQLDRGATLQALPYSAETKSGSYPHTSSRFTDFVSATDAHDLAITGLGTINGDGEAWWAAFRANHSMPHRPYMVKMNNCQKVLIAGVTLTKSPMFHAALNAVNHLTVFGITINSPDAPNTDGLDPSGTHQLFQNCSISCGDDNIVMKPGGTFCSGITVADCAFGIGHGMSVGGQSNHGLDGMTVKNCYFEGTTSALRLKADPTQGGEVKNITYSNLVMHNVEFPIVFYSYYNVVGNPGSISGSNQTTPEKVKLWNATPPNALGSKTLPSWKDITITHLISTGTRGYSVIWGLPLAGYFIDNVKLNNVHITGGLGFEIFNATNIQFSGEGDVGPLITANAVVLAHTPQSQTVTPGASTTFTASLAGTDREKATAPTYQWTFNGAPLTDGKKDDGCTISGATSATLKLDGVQRADAGKYSVTVSTALDIFDVATKSIIPSPTPATATSTSAILAIASTP